MKDLDQFNNPDDFLNDLEKGDKKPVAQKQSTNKEPKSSPPQSPKKLTQGQKFFLAFLFFFLVLIFGFFIMLITGSMVIPL